MSFSLTVRACYEYLRIASEQRPAVKIIGTDMDLLVILVFEATSEMNLHICGNNPLIVHYIQAVQGLVEI